MYLAYPLVIYTNPYKKFVMINRIILLEEQREVALKLAYLPVRAGLFSLKQFFYNLLISLILATYLGKFLFKSIRNLNCRSSSLFICHIEYSKYRYLFILFCFHYSIVTIPSIVKEKKNEGNSIWFGNNRIRPIQG